MLTGFIIIVCLCIVELAGAYIVLSSEDNPLSQEIYEPYENFFYDKESIDEDA